MFDHFGRRLQRDLQHIVDGRIQTSELASGSLIRVSSEVTSREDTRFRWKKLLIVDEMWRG